MNKKELLEYFNIRPSSIKNKKNATIIQDGENKYVLKKRTRKADIFDYLVTRNFNYFPKIYSRIDDEYDLVDYIADSETPLEQKLQDVVYLASLLHTKTTFYKTLDEDSVKSIYEDIVSRLEYIYQYYNELQDMIEVEVYMSPANYFLIRNSSMIYLSIRKAREYIEQWYTIMKEKKRMRYAFIHGNLEGNHLIESDNLYFVSWDNARIDLPIYDIEIFYKKSFLDIGIEEILQIYQSKYPLEKEELNLLMAILLIPDKIDMGKSEYLKTKEVTNLIYYLDKTLTYLENNTKKPNNNQPH